MISLALFLSPFFFLQLQAIPQDVRISNLDSNKNRKRSHLDLIVSRKWTAYVCLGTGILVYFEDFAFHFRICICLLIEHRRETEKSMILP